MNCSDLTHGNIIGLRNVKFLFLYIIDPFSDAEPSIILFFYSPKQNEPIILSKLPIIPVLFPGFAFHRCRIGHRILKLNYMPRDN